MGVHLCMQTNMALNRKYIVNGDSSASILNAPWIRIDNENSVGFAVTMTGSNTGTWSAEGTMVEDPVNFPPTAAQIVQIPAPAGHAGLQPAATAVSALFDFQPAPSVVHIRFKYVRSANGAAGSTNVQSLAKGV
jgi:hypothetical protein